MEIAAIGAVDIYALISGYVCYGRKWNPQNLIRLWAQAIFYCLTIDIIFILIYGKVVISPMELFSVIFPMTKGVYWYLTSYAAVFVFIPVLNRSIDTMDRSMAVRIIVTGVVLSWWDLISDKNIFKLDAGYSPVWLGFLYFTGAYISKYYSEGKHKVLFRKYCGYIYTAVICMVFALVVVMQKITLDVFGKAKGDRFLIGYTAPPILIAAIAILLYFSAIEIKRAKVIEFFAPAAFGVYLIHNHPLTAEYMMPYIFGRYSGGSFWKTLLVLLAGAACIFIFATLIDKVRNLIFLKLKIYMMCSKCSDLLISFINKVWDRFAFLLS